MFSFLGMSGALDDGAGGGGAGFSEEAAGGGGVVAGCAATTGEGVVAVAWDKALCLTCLDTGSPIGTAKLSEGNAEEDANGDGADGTEEDGIGGGAAGAIVVREATDVVDTTALETAVTTDSVVVE
jgi:hypothetical protein